MKRKFFPIILSAVLLALGCGISASCSGNDEFSFKVASGVRASLSDNGRYGFVLTVKGEGEIPDYASAKDAPWYRKSGRITDVVIGEGITKIGDNAFTDCKVRLVEGDYTNIKVTTPEDMAVAETLLDGRPC